MLRDLDEGLIVVDIFQKGMTLVEDSGRLSLKFRDIESIVVIPDFTFPEQYAIKNCPVGNHVLDLPPEFGIWRFNPHVILIPKINPVVVPVRKAAVVAHAGFRCPGRISRMSGKHEIADPHGFGFTGVEH